MTDGLRIEFVGLPAAGKTHASRQAHAALVERGIAARLDEVEDWRADRPRMVGDAVGRALRRERGVTVAGSLAWLARHRDPGRPLRSAAGACLYLAAVDAHVRSLGFAPAWLHDQATVQALWSLSMRSGADPGQVAGAHASRLSWPDLVVEVRAPLPTIAGRLRQRASLPSSLRACADDLPGALSRGQATIAALERVAVGRSVRWLALGEGGGGAAEVARRVERELA